MSNTGFAASVYIGVWTDWSHGSVRGLTLTITKRNGDLLTAFLALFATIVGRSFWRLFCFVAHRFLSKDTAQDAFYHQRQAVLRNADEAIVGLRAFLQVAWSWRGRSQQLWQKIFPMIGITALLMVGLQVASVFSPQISTNADNEVLISSPRCGLVPHNVPDIQTYRSMLLQYQSKLIIACASYAQDCYIDNGTAQDCSMFVKRQIPPVVSRNTSCPFPAREVCAQEWGNLRIDSGSIDSHHDLGINASPQDRFSYRQILECAPLRSDGYLRKVNGTNVGSSNTTLQAMYGEAFANHANDSVTYRWPLDGQNTLQDYILRTFTFAPSKKFNEFTPIPDLLREGSDIGLFFLMGNAVKAIEPCDDYFFAAHKPVNVEILVTDSPFEGELYSFDDVAHALGCMTQHQLCFGPDRCTPFQDFNFANPTTLNLTSTQEQRRILDIWLKSFQTLRPHIPNVAGQLGPSALLARNSFTCGVQGPLHPNQWQLEVEHWQAILMSFLQRTIVEHATGPSDSTMEAYVEKSPDKETKHICHSQKVKSASHTSFSVFGLCICFVTGGFLILAEMVADPVCHRIQSHRNVGLHRQLEWVANETLQLQRMAHEGLGAGTWTGGAETIPTTERHESLATLDVTDKKHPRLHHSPSLQDKDETASSGCE